MSSNGAETDASKQQDRDLVLIDFLKQVKKKQIEDAKSKEMPHRPEPETKEEEEESKMLLDKHLSQFKETMKVQPRRHTETQLAMENNRQLETEEMRRAQELAKYRKRNLAEFKQNYQKGDKLVDDNTGVQCDSSEVNINNSNLRVNVDVKQTPAVMQTIEAGSPSMAEIKDLHRDKCYDTLPHVPTVCKPPPGFTAIHSTRNAPTIDRDVIGKGARSKTSSRQTNFFPTENDTHWEDDMLKKAIELSLKEPNSPSNAVSEDRSMNKLEKADDDYEDDFDDLPDLVDDDPPWHAPDSTPSWTSLKDAEISAGECEHAGSGLACSCATGSRTNTQLGSDDDNLDLQKALIESLSETKVDIPRDHSNIKNKLKSKVNSKQAALSESFPDIGSDCLPVLKTSEKPEEPKVEEPVDYLRKLSDRDDSVTPAVCVPEPNSEDGAAVDSTAEPCGGGTRGRFCFAMSPTDDWEAEEAKAMLYEEADEQPDVECNFPHHVHYRIIADGHMSGARTPESALSTTSSIDDDCSTAIFSSEYYSAESRAVSSAEEGRLDVADFLLNGLDKMEMDETLAASELLLSLDLHHDVTPSKYTMECMDHRLPGHIGSLHVLQLGIGDGIHQSDTKQRLVEYLMGSPGHNHGETNEQIDKCKNGLGLSSEELTDVSSETEDNLAFAGNNVSEEQGSPGTRLGVVYDSIWNEDQPPRASKSGNDPQIRTTDIDTCATRGLQMKEKTNIPTTAGEPKRLIHTSDSNNNEISQRSYGPRVKYRAKQKRGYIPHKETDLVNMHSKNIPTSSERRKTKYGPRRAIEELVNTIDTPVNMDLCCNMRGDSVETEQRDRSLPAHDRCIPTSRSGSGDPGWVGSEDVRPQTRASSIEDYDESERCWRGNDCHMRSCSYVHPRDLKTDGSSSDIEAEVTSDDNHRNRRDGRIAEKGFSKLSTHSANDNMQSRGQSDNVQNATSCYKINVHGHKKNEDEFPPDAPGVRGCDTHPSSSGRGRGRGSPCFEQWRQQNNLAKVGASDREHRSSESRVRSREFSRSRKGFPSRYDPEDGARKPNLETNANTHRHYSNNRDTNGNEPSKARIENTHGGERYRQHTADWTKDGGRTDHGTTSGNRSSYPRPTLPPRLLRVREENQRRRQNRQNYQNN